MADNTVVFDGKTYDLNELSDECQLACSLLQEVQQEVVLQSRKLDIYRASSVTLTQKVKELVSEDALVDEVASTED
tara:strand:- start:392 stop:619 length:228 start_codon:yes stop_codon:yes gene_type:complete